MKNHKVISHAGLTIDLATIKCLKLSTFSDLGKTNILVVEFKTRYDYIENPKTGEFEKQEYNEQTEIEFSDYETAKVYRLELDEIWEDYLNDINYE